MRQEWEQAAELLARYRSGLLAVMRLKRENKRLIARSGPGNNLTSVMSADKGCYTPPARPDAYNALAAVAGNCCRLQALLAETELIEEALAVLPADERLLLVMRYVDGHSMAAIAEGLQYASRQSVYTAKSKALQNFSANLGLKA